MKNSNNKAFSIANSIKRKQCYRESTSLFRLSPNQEKSCENRNLSSCCFNTDFELEISLLLVILNYLDTLSVFLLIIIGFISLSFVDLRIEV